MLDQQVISDWIKARLVVMGRGGSKKAAEILDIAPSTLSHVLRRNGAAFDQKTLNMMAWILLTKQEYAPEGQAEEVRRVEDLIFSRYGDEWFWRIAE